MARRKQRLTDRDIPTHVNPSENWTRVQHAVINGRHIEPGTQLTITGERGRFVFTEHVTNPANGAEWFDCRAMTGQYRSFRPERVSRVHYKKKVR